jgi:chemotaxis protein MotB
VFAVASLFVLSLVGCNRSNQYLASQPAVAAPATAGAAPSFFQGWLGGGTAAPEAFAIQQQFSARETDLNRRLVALDENNRQLQTQLAQAQQQAQIAAEERALLRRQLADASNQLQQSRVSNSETQNRLDGLSNEYRGLQSANQWRGGARLTANSSLKGRTEALSQLGFPVFQEGDVVRLRIPADQLFQPNTANPTPNAAEILDRVAEVVRSEFARQRIAVESHTDAGPFYGGNFSTAQQLSAAQSTAVVESMQRRSRLPSGQLFSVAHGTNHSVADNQTPAGRAQNRRIEIVIYPDTF